MVEDEHRIANSIKKGLEIERFAVDVAYDGETGLDMALSEDYDLILLDLMLPGVDGISICKQVRSEGKHTPILMLTARGQTHEKVEGLDSGADDYLTKPFSFEELLARIRALSRRPKSEVGNLLSVADLKLDVKGFEAERDKVKIRLSGKEFSLLEYMMRHPKQILTKKQIIDHVWNYDADVLPNTVEVNIRNLRQKIDAPFPHLPALIETIRGFGYRIGENNV